MRGLFSQDLLTVILDFNSLYFVSGYFALVCGLHSEFCAAETRTPTLAGITQHADEWTSVAAVSVRPECDDRDNPRVALRCTLKLSKEYPTAAEASVELRYVTGH